jgi:hypothetical protein
VAGRNEQSSLNSNPWPIAEGVSVAGRIPSEYRVPRVKCSAVIVQC